MENKIEEKMEKQNLENRLKPLECIATVGSAIGLATIATEAMAAGNYDVSKVIMDPNMPLKSRGMLLAAGAVLYGILSVSEIMAGSYKKAGGCKN